MNVFKRVLGIYVLLFAATVFGEVKPATIFTDGAVLQQNTPVRIWGDANPGESVEIEFAAQRVSTKADADGRWMVALKPIPASSTPRKMVFYSHGKKQIALGNVVVGEVWLAGGQSNMETTMRNYRKTVQPDIDSASDPLLRMVTIPRLEFEGQNSKRPEWKATTPENVKGFSATAYYFAKNLREKLNVPVGIVSCSVGATPAEAWMSRETLSSTPGLKRILDAYEANVREKYQDVEEYLRLAEKRERTLEAWQKKQKSGEKPLPPYPAEVMGPRNYKRPCGLHETMLTQTIPYTLRGVIWYQGENNANADAGFHYRTVFPALINEWRSEFMNPGMPFLFVQLATFGPARDTSAKWPELRDAQQWTEDSVENCGMVVLADGGDIDNIHPHSKDKAGLRLSLLARHMAYGEKELVCRGPRLEKVNSRNHQLELTFKNIGSGLELKTVEATPFEICGKDGKYVPAEAKLVDGKIIVSAEGVEEPKHIRYGWRKWFEPTLFNKEGLPASPFKTDDFNPESKERYYLDNL
jgi:sialate O-acetylesterase